VKIEVLTGRELAEQDLHEIEAKFLTRLLDQSLISYQVEACAINKF